jgi:hypothetical protein
MKNISAWTLRLLPECAIPYETKDAGYGVTNDGAITEYD